MINKFKNALKVGKKNKDNEIHEAEVVLEESVNDLDVENNIEESDNDELMALDQDENIEVENIDEADEDADELEAVPDVMEDPEASEFLFNDEPEEEIEPDTGNMCVVGSFKKDREPGRSVEDAGIPVEEFELKSLVASTLKQFAPVIIKKGIRLELEGLDRKVVTNEEVMLFIFQEILSNAVNSLMQGSIRIFMDEDTLVFEDTGYGIPAEEVEKIFEEGFMASNAQPGDDLEGMGMYKCSIALEKMNYGYGIKSAVGVGTIFSIDLSK